MLLSIMDTPPSPTASRRGSLDSDDDLDNYFASYVPLSSLPTPPEPSVFGTHLVERKASYEPPSNENHLSGPAIHLANLVPSGLCLHRPSPSIIQMYLERFTLPLETIALAGCILDSLSLKFGRKFREAYASSSVNAPSCPEVVVLASLALATTYHIDDHLLASHWTGIVAANAVTVQQYNIASRSILIDIGYGLHAITPDMVEETVRDMQWAGKTTFFEQPNSCYFTAPKTKHSGTISPGHGNAVEANGLMTPEPTPQ